MRILIVGGSGFIGSHVVDSLVGEGAEVVVFARGPERFRPPLAQVTYIGGDLADGAALDRALSPGFDAVIHLASTTVPDTAEQDPLTDVENLRGFVRLLQLCVKREIPKVVFASSGGTVYGVPKTLPVSEDHATDPICSYGVTKLAMEKYLQCYARLYGLQYVTLRLANVYGSRQDPDRSQGAIAIFLARALRGEPLTVWGDGSVVRDFVHVRDVARLCTLALHSSAVGVFNAGSGEGVSINDLLRLVSAQLNRSLEIVRQPSREFDVPAVVLDCRKAKAVYSWQPQVGLANGLAEVTDWLQQSGRKLDRQSVSRPYLTVG